MVPSDRRTRAIVSARVLRKVAACALPRPSAIASAKLAKSTVNHNHSATSPANTFSFVVDDPRSRKKRIVVRTDPTSTTNITGFRIIVRGLSLTKLSLIACRVIAGSNSLRAAGGRAPYPCGRKVGRGSCERNGGRVGFGSRRVRVRGRALAVVRAPVPRCFRWSEADPVRRPRAGGRVIFASGVGRETSDGAAALQSLNFGASIR